MLGALIIVFREVIEAGIIVGIVLAVTARRRAARRWIAGGVGGGRRRRLLVAAFAEALADALARASGQELFNGSILAVAVADAGLAQRLDGEPRPGDGREMREVGEEVRAGVAFARRARGRRRRRRACAKARRSRCSSTGSRPRAVRPRRA